MATKKANPKRNHHELPELYLRTCHLLLIKRGKSFGLIGMNWIASTFGIEEDQWVELIWILEKRVRLY